MTEQAVVSLDLQNKSLDLIVEDFKNLPVFEKEHVQFLQQHREHLNKVLEKTYIWRTDTQKRQILNDVHHPTLHNKFHQSILEQKVQFEQTLYLARDYELKRLELQELELEIKLVEAEDLPEEEKQKIIAEVKEEKRKITLRRLEIEKYFKNFELKNMKISMEYRMRELTGWQKIIDELTRVMHEKGLSDEVIWDKEAGELSYMFYYGLNLALSAKEAGKLETGDMQSILGIMDFVIKEAKAHGIYEEFKKSLSQQQLEVLNFFESKLNLQ